AGWLVARPSWRRTLAYAGLALVIPLAYEGFRAGYYGTLVPLPALAKSASDAEWVRGIKYLWRFCRGQLLYVPLGVVTIVAFAELHTGVFRSLGRNLGRNLVVLAAPIVTAALLGVFVVRVGGDFMHGRMLLPSTLLLIAPVLVLPLRRLMALALLPLVAWGLYIAIGFYTDTRQVARNERRVYTRFTHQRNPTDEVPYVHMVPQLVDIVHAAVRDRRPALFFETAEVVAMNPAHDAPVAGVFSPLGLG